jgi:hypothetical protein
MCAPNSDRESPTRLMTATRMPGAWNGSGALKSV